MSEHKAGQPSGQLAEVIGACSHAQDAVALTAQLMPTLADLLGADAAVAVHKSADGLHAAAAHGIPLDVSALDQLDGTGTSPWQSVSTPRTWRKAGIEAVRARVLPGPGRFLLAAWAGPAPELPGDSEEALAVLELTLGRLDAEERLTDLRSRMDTAQKLAGMGDYDWHIATDSNEWSNQLYRIYGYEPQSFNASYERFLSLVHPDDREKVTQVHQTAYASGEPYEMVERVVRPDGEVRHLATNGQVLFDESGTPTRFRGTCVDITDRVMAERSRERSAERFRALVEASPDAVVVLDPDRKVIQANGRAREVLEGDPVGHHVGEFLPAGLDGEERGVAATSVAGGDLTLDVTLAELSGAAAEGMVAAFLRDAAPRLARESLAAGLREAQVRRRQALEINDNVVQGLTAAVYALEAGEQADAASYLDRTLRAARRMMTDLLYRLDGADLQPGDLVRSEASALEPAVVTDNIEEPTLSNGAVSAAVRVEPAERRAHRVLVVDDSDDVRMLLRLKLETTLGCDVVGEASDGLEAVEMAGSLQPELVLLDLAMPRMDGLQALPRIFEVAPSARVVVLSGFDREAMAEQAVRAGATSYLEKGAALAALAHVVDSAMAG